MDDEIVKSTIDPKLIGVGLVGLVVGVGIGYLLGKRKRDFVKAAPAVPPQDWTLAELALVKNEEVEDDPVVHPEAQAFIQERMSETVEVEVERRQIFGEAIDSTWDYDIEVQQRSEAEPFVIHRDEYFDNESEYHQGQLTYYAGDDMLVDEENTPIYNPAQIVGPYKFGHGSGDTNVFYVRNDKLRGEYEVIKDSGLYSVEVLGLDAEEEAENVLEHSSIPRRFRQD